MKDSSWTLEISTNTLELKFIEIFFSNSPMCPIYNRNGIYNKLDTLNVEIRFGENWSDSRMDSLARKNRIVLEPIIEKYMALQDSLKWKNIKYSREIFIERPYSNLKHWS